jgi:hypothetical protein
MPFQANFGKVTPAVCHFKILRRQKFLPSPPVERADYLYAGAPPHNRNVLPQEASAWSRILDWHAQRY